MGFKGYYHSLANASYDWPRFWYPEGTDLKLYGSYLPDPEDSFNHLVNPDIIRVHSISSQLFNVFLGEPGIGKSTSLRQEFEELRSTWAANGEDAEWLDLGIVTGLADLRILFDEQLIANWLAGTHILHLFLDSLDEALPAFPSLPKALLQTLERLPRDRLRLSLICQPGEWYASFHNALIDLSALELPHIYVLAPLRREDIYKAAVQAGIQDAETFIGLIADRDAEPFAATPVTLAFLLGEYISGKGLPAELSELYRRGCIVLCAEEYSSSRDASRRLDADQCVILAGRMACLTELSARPLISSQAADASAEGILSVSNIVGDGEMASGDSFGVGKADALEVLHRPLFRAVGSRFRWAHKSYAEFLAAHYLVAHSLPLRQIVLLLRHPFDVSGRVAPSLSGVAGWIATMREDLFDHLLRADPEVLFLADLSMRTGKQRAALVEWLLDQAREESPFVTRTLPLCRPEHQG